MTDKSFAALELGPQWLENLEQLGYEEMTGIQAAALPVMLKGTDVIGLANTGTGKTAAFGLALLSKITPSGRLPGALVLCPTRELADQVAEELRRLARPLANTNVITICGGRSFSRQKQALDNGVDIIVGTPGRVLDHLNKETLVLTKATTVVLDEADRMLDMGFFDDVEAIIGKTPSHRQTLLFSATLPDEIRELSDRIQKDAHFIEARAAEETPDISQVLYDIGEMERLEVLERVLEKHRPQSAVIFCNQRDTCEDVLDRLLSLGYDAATLHGGMEQQDRDRTLLLFSNRSLKLLVATNVAARGIDIEELDAVINYELPRESKTFVHRVGRTGRAGEEGLAISLVSDNDERRINELDDHLGQITPRKASSLQPHGHRPEPAPMMTVAIQGGRKDKLRPGDIVGAITGDFGFDGSEIGDIKILDRIAFVALSRKIANDVLNKVQKGRIKNRTFRAFMVTSQ